MAEEQCNRLLAEGESTSDGVVVRRVRERIAREPGRSLRMEQVAVDLNMSVRTLRRRLQEEGTTFQAVLDNVREVLADELLSTTRLPMHDIAERLGYSEPASFIHAFKRWRGMTPHGFRMQGRAAGP